MVSFTAWHLRSFPYKFNLLNSVEGRLGRGDPAGARWSAKEAEAAGR